MKSLFLWPAIVMLFWIGLELYGRIYPCESGLFIGLCGFANLIFDIMLVESVVVYSVLVWAMIRWKKRRKRTLYWYEPIFGGVASVVMVFGSMLVTGSWSWIPIGDAFIDIGFPLSVISYPFFISAGYIFDVMMKLGL